MKWDGMEWNELEKWHEIKSRMKILWNKTEKRRIKYGETSPTHLLRSSDLSDLRAVKVVETVDVLHHALAVGLDGGQDEQVLQVLVLGEVRPLRHVHFRSSFAQGIYRSATSLSPVVIPYEQTWHLHPSWKKELTKQKVKKKKKTQHSQKREKMLHWGYFLCIKKDVIKKAGFQQRVFQ